MADQIQEQQWGRDHDTLHAVVTGLTQLERQWNEARVSVVAQQRGYFTPDEDDWVRQILLTYRNYRLALYQIIHRYWGCRRIPELEGRLRSFVLALASALVLYSHSLKLIQAYEREPLVRKKLNEPDAKFELEEGFFDTVLCAYSSLGNYRELIKAVWYWRCNRRAIQRMLAGSDWNWLVHLVRTERVVVRQRLMQVLLCRLRYDWRAFWQTTIQPVRKTRYSVQALIGGACAGLRTTTHYQPALNASVMAELKGMLQPGDVLLVRAEEKLTGALLPGFWAHAALYVGRVADLAQLGLVAHQHVAKHLVEVERQGESWGAVVEAISPRVLVNRLEESLQADHVLVLRPNLAHDQIAAALGEAFGHVGKLYDFEFDFNVSTRLVCTELIYRCYHKRGQIQFSLTKRLGRFTLSADDIANGVLECLLKANQPEQTPFAVRALVLKMADGLAHFVPPSEALHALRRIQSGWRPLQAREEALHA